MVEGLRAQAFHQAGRVAAAQNRVEDSHAAFAWAGFLFACAYRGLGRLAMASRRFGTGQNIVPDLRMERWPLWRI